MTFALNCNTFGRKFSFTASSLEDAISKAKDRCLYHSFNFNEGYTIEETTDASDLHNEYIK